MVTEGAKNKGSTIWLHLVLRKHNNYISLKWSEQNCGQRYKSNLRDTHLVDNQNTSNGKKKQSKELMNPFETNGTDGSVSKKIEQMSLFENILGKK